MIWLLYKGHESSTLLILFLKALNVLMVLYESFNKFHRPLVEMLTSGSSEFHFPLRRI